MAESVLRTEDFKTYHNTILKPKITEITEAQAELQEVVSRFETGIQANTDAITKLNGADTEDGSVKKIVKDAINTFASDVSDDETINTYAEALQYIKNHGAEYTTLLGQVTKNETNITAAKNSVSALETKVTGIDTTVKSHTTSISSLLGQVDTLKEGIPEYSTVSDVTSLTW